MRWSASVDMYRRVPTDLLEGTRRGQIFSLFAVASMATLFFFETRAFLSSTLKTDLTLDRNRNPRSRVNFNITMMDLRCEWAVVDVVSVLGTEQNVTQNLNKWAIDGAGVRQGYHGRNKRQKDVILKDSSVKRSLDDLHQNGEDAVALDEEMLQKALLENAFVFVDFYAGWCSHCRDFAPTWETLAELMQGVAHEKVSEMIKSEQLESAKRLTGDPVDSVDNQHRRLSPMGIDDDIDPYYEAMDDKEFDYDDMDDMDDDDDDDDTRFDDFDTKETHHYTEADFKSAVELERPILIAKVDCVLHEELCKEQRIQGYPTLRLFVDGEKYNNDYHGHRTVLDIANYLAAVEHDYEGESGLLDKAEETERKRQRKPVDSSWKKDRKIQPSWIEEDHPGCQISGFLMVDRVPGNFHIKAKSKSHDLVPQMTNVSHEVHNLSFGEPFVNRNLQKTPGEIPLTVVDKINPFDNFVYVNHNLHEAYHHHMKVITTTVPHARDRVYQILEQSQLSHYRTDIVPEAKFIYDLSPVAVSYRKESRKWYDYLTSLMAIIGGSFTLIGMFDSSIGRFTSKKKR